MSRQSRQATTRASSRKAAVSGVSRGRRSRPPPVPPPKSIPFTLEGREVPRYLDFRGLHNGSKCGPISVVFTPTGIGPNVSVVCPCGEQELITDVATW